MSVQRYVASNGKVRYRARIKFQGREITTRVFDRKKDASDWEQEQVRRLRMGEWIDPNRGKLALAELFDHWLPIRKGTVKRRTWETDVGNWQRYIKPRFGNWPVGSLTTVTVISVWLAELLRRGLTAATVTRVLATLRALLEYAVEDRRIRINVASQVKSLKGSVRREGRALTYEEVVSLVNECTGKDSEIVRVLAMTGLRWGEFAGLKVGDVVRFPGLGLRVQRAVLASNGGGQLYEDTSKTGRFRTVPLAPELRSIVESRARGRDRDEWLFAAPMGGPLRESNWKRSVGWRKAVTSIGHPTLRVHDLRHTAASLWLASGADPKVVQEVLGHASGVMTIDLYGHLVDANLWAAAEGIGGTRGASRRRNRRTRLSETTTEAQ